MDPKELYLSKPWLKYYPEGVPHTVEVPETTVPELFDGMADKYGKKTALIFYGKKISYKELKESDRSFCRRLDRSGCSKGRHGGTVSAELSPVRDRLFRRLENRRQGDADQPGLHQQRGQTPVEDSEAKTVVCEDILYENVERTGVELDNVILSNIGDYLPRLKKMFGKATLNKAYQGRQCPQR